MKNFNLDIDAMIANYIAAWGVNSSDQWKQHVAAMFNSAAKKADTQRNAKLVAELTAKGGSVMQDASYGYCYVNFDDNTQKKIRKATAEALITLNLVTSERNFDADGF